MTLIESYELIEPHEYESYQDYINRLSSKRLFGWKNKPKDFYTEGHHILPRCLGGKDNNQNIIILLPQEHYFCHKLLAIENPQNSKLQYAWFRMCHNFESDVKRTYFVSAEDYAEARLRCAELSAEMNGIPVVEFVTGVVYPSAEEAARTLGIKCANNITSCCKKTAKSANGYKFCYLSDYQIGNYENLTVGKRKRIIDLDTLIIYESSVDAAQQLNLSKVMIRAVCRGERKSTGGHRFALYSDYLAGNYELKKIGQEGKKIQDVKSGVIYNSMVEAAQKLSLDVNSISKVCRGKIKSTHGYIFKYYEENND